MAATPSDPLQRFFRFLGSIQLAMILIIACAIAMIAGTIIESRHSAEIAKALVYQTWWFWGIQILIALNLSFAVINRLPLQRHQFSFAIVHAGFVMMLAGGLITSMFGFEGQLRVTEGQTSSTLVLGDLELALRSDGLAGESLPVPSGQDLRGRVLRKEGDGRPGIRILDYVENGVMEEGLEAGAATDPPGVRFSIYPEHGSDDDHGHGPEVTGWLLAGDPHNSLHDYNVMLLELLRFDDPAAYAERAAAQPLTGGSYRVRIERGLGFAPVEIDLPAQLDQEIDAGDGLTAKVTAFAEHAMVSGGTIQETEGGRLNPAAVLILKQGDIEEHHTLFSQHPDFAAVKGGGEEPLTGKVLLLAPEGGGGRLAFRFLVDPQGALALQVEGPEGRQAARPVAAGGRIAIPGLAFALVVDDYFPGARTGLKVTRLTSKEDQGSTLMQLALTLGVEQQQKWITYGRDEAVELGGRTWSMVYRSMRHPLPFKVGLSDFRIEYHPGSRRESEYSSMVEVTALAGEVAPVSTEIAMNRPLDYMGFRMFQSSYILGRNGGPDTTILSVNRDPGAGVVYWAFGILIFGIGWFVLGDGKKKRNGKKRQRQTPAVSAAPAVPGAPGAKNATGAAEGTESLETVS